MLFVRQVQQGKYQHREHACYSMDKGQTPQGKKKKKQGHGFETLNLNINNNAKMLCSGSTLSVTTPDTLKENKKLNSSLRGGYPCFLLYMLLDLSLSVD